MNNFYQEDLAFVHDQGYSDLSVHAAGELIALLHRSHFDHGLVIDLGCGSGKLTGRLSEAGYETVGVDLSASLLERAKVHSPKTRFIRQSVWDFKIEPCVAVTAIGEILNYRFDDQNSDENILDLFQRIYDQLPDQGIFLFDYLERDVLDGRSYDCKLVEDPDWTMAVEYFEDKSIGDFIRKITLFRKLETGTFRRSQEIHCVRLFSSQHILSMLKTAGFTSKIIHQYQGYSLRSKHLAIIAQKRYEPF